MKTIQLKAIMLDEKCHCQDCGRWKLLSEEERDLIGATEFISLGKCQVDGHMSEDSYECIFLNSYLPIIEQTCYTCSNEHCKEHGTKNQGCKDWRHQLARYQL